MTLASAIAALIMVVSVSTANASLLGTNVTVTNTFGGTIFQGPTTVPVTSGGPELTAFGGFWDIDIQDSSIDLVCNGGACRVNNFTNLDEYLFEGLDWGGSGFLLDATLSSNCACTPNALSFPTNTSLLLSFNKGSPQPNSGNTIFIQLVPSHIPSQIPEPGTLTLFGLGLAGLGYMRRRRAA